jgi:hypothetical protein
MWGAICAIFMTAFCLPSRKCKRVQCRKFHSTPPAQSTTRARDWPVHARDCQCRLRILSQSLAPLNAPGYSNKSLRGEGMRLPQTGRRIPGIITRKMRWRSSLSPVD